MGKLHELLAVEQDLRAKAQSAMAKAKSLFTDGQGKLVGQIRTYRPLTEGGEPQPDESTVLATTVADELRSLRDSFLGWLDAAVQKEVTNQGTSADVVVDDKTLLKGLPAPALLNLEAKLTELRQVLSAVPTNDPSESWEWSAQEGRYVSKERITFRTKKVMKSFLAHEATKEHPAQVQVYNEDERVGTWTTVIHSGMLSPTRKAILVDRLDALILGVRRARQRANDIDTNNLQVGDTLWEFLFRE